MALYVIRSRGLFRLAGKARECAIETATSNTFSREQLICIAAKLLHDNLEDQAQ